MRLLFLPLLLVTFAGCASHRDFTPREYLNGTSADGHPAAIYPFPGGELRVWSGGTDPAPAPDDAVTELHLGFELENNGGEPLRLCTEELVVDRLFVGDAEVVDLRPVRAAGEAEAMPGTTATYEAWFRPGQGRPRDVRTFSVRFVVAGGGKPLLVQVSPFAPYIARDRFDDVDPWYWHQPRGFGFFGYYHRW